MSAYRVTLIVIPQDHGAYSDDTPDMWDWARLLDLPRDHVSFESSTPVPDPRKRSQRQQRAQSVVADAIVVAEEDVSIDCE